MTYEIINAVTTNTLAAYESEDKAREAYEGFVQADPAHAGELALVAFDKDGDAKQLLSAPAVAELAN